jgi:hypothetical protein
LFDLPPGVTFRYGLRWTPDGTAVAYRDWVNGIWRQPVAGGEPERLPGLPEEKLFAYGWSPDGKQFCTRAQKFVMSCAQPQMMKTSQRECIGR